MSGAATMAKMRRALRELADVPSRASKQAAVAIDNRVQDMFSSEADPYGVAWPALAASTVKRKGGNSVVLYRTGQTQAQSHAYPAPGSGVRIVFGPIAAWHMAPSGTRPARPVAPLRGLPPAWRADIAQAVLDTAKKIVK